MKLSEKQIKRGYWYFRPDENFHPNGKLLEEYNGEKLLSLALTKGNETASQIKKREKVYASEIPMKLDTLKVLWVYNINQETFDAICQLQNLESLYVQSNKEA